MISQRIVEFFSDKFGKATATKGEPKKKAIEDKKTPGSADKKYQEKKPATEEKK